MKVKWLVDVILWYNSDVYGCGVRGGGGGLKLCIIFDLCMSSV